MSARWQLPAARLPGALAVAVLAALASACRAGDTGFDESRARAHVTTLAGTIGSRPTGTPANVRARQYLVDELGQMGFAVRIQEAEAVNEEIGLTTRVANVIAIREGPRQDAIGLVAHYDSVPEADGAVDDAIGVATCLEAARALLRERLNHTLIVLFTDAEELGLMGARAAVADPVIRQRLRYFLNFDGTGAAGPSLLFETTGSGAALSAWARHAPAPSGTSVAIEVYKRLPNDTDFTVLETTGASGLNFGAIADAYAYHTDRDVAGRVRPETLRHGGNNTVAIVRALDAADRHTPRGGDATYFDIARRLAVLYGPRQATLFAWSACVIAGAVWLLLTRDVWRARRLPGLFLVAFWSGLTSAAAAGAMIGAAWWIRASRDELNPWYAAPHWFFMWLLAAGIAAAWIVGRLRESVPEGARPWRAPQATWWVTLPIWIALAIVLQRFAPVASYLVTLPLLGIALLLIVSRRWPGAIRPASIAVAVVASLLWVTRTGELLGFLVPLFGWLPVVPPVWLFPAVIGLSGVMLAPPLVAAVTGLRRVVSPPLVTAGVLLSLVASGVAAYRSPAYTNERPARRAARYIQDDTRSEAWWEVAGTERVLGLRTPGPVGEMWQPVTTPPRTATSLGPLRPPFRFRTVTIPLVTTPPADVRATLSDDALGRTALEIVVAGREPFAARVVLPEGVVPAESTLAGRITDGRWTGMYVAPPPPGLNVKMTFDKLRPGALDNTVVVVTVTGLPGGTGRLRLPEWLPQERATWWARSQFILPVVPERAVKKHP